MNQISKFFSLIKFSHTIFAMPFAAIGISIGFMHTDFHVDPVLIIKVLLCMVFARSSAMAFNRYIDRQFDALNGRTAVREIPSGKVSPRAALLFTVSNALLFIAVTATINLVCFLLSPVALAIILGYSYTKRFTPLCHLILGLGLSLAPIGAYLAVTGVFHLLPVLFSFIVLTWVSGFDIIYALQDEEFDRSQRLFSIPVSFGTDGALKISTTLHVLTAALIIVVPLLSEGWGTLYWIGAGIFIVLLFYQHLLVKPHDLSKVNLAFATTNGIASLVFGLITVVDLFLS